MKIKFSEYLKENKEFRYDKELLNILKYQHIVNVIDGIEYKTVINEDFVIKYSVTKWSHVTLNWIYNRSFVYHGRDIFRALVKLTKDLGYDKICAYGAKGYDTYTIDDDVEGRIKFEIDDVGYYHLLVWGFIPEYGVKYINKILNSKYESMSDAFNDSSFWHKWKTKGVGLACTFYTDDDSLSMTQLNKLS